MMRIIEATEKHLPGVLEIMREAISPSWTHAALLSEIKKNDSFFLIAVEDTTEPSPCVKGFAVMRQVDDSGELLQIAVEKMARGSGIGNLLMDAVLTYAKNNKFCSVFLEVRKSNEAAVRLYEKHGFESMRIRKDYYDSPVEDAVVMVKQVLH